MTILSLFLAGVLLAIGGTVSLIWTWDTKDSGYSYFCIGAGVIIVMISLLVSTN